MHLFYLLLIVILHLYECKPVKSGVFDNVTVYANKRKIVIDFDDFLSKYVGNFENITIINQYIPKLEADSVSNLFKAKNITLVKNGIREIHKGAFKNLQNLKNLNLSSNCIEEIYFGVFNNLPSLETLFLDHNQISRIGYKAFGNLNLKCLFLNNNKISRWNKDWLADSSVLNLDLSYNLIGDLPSNSFHLMSKPVNNMSLIFTGNQLKKINNHVFNGLKKFQKIYLDSNLIDRLETAAFDGVKHVNMLNLNNNSITDLPKELFENVEVDVLMLEDNKIRCLSTEIFNMEELDIDGNPITCSCVKIWLDWRDVHSHPSIFHITNLEQDCI